LSKKTTKPKKVKPKRVKRVKRILTPAEQVVSDKNRDKRLRALFNVCSEEYETMLLAQNGVCAVTGRASNNNLHIDHDHDSGLIRGLLSPWANAGLVYFNDNPVLLRAAAAYLESPPATAALGEEVYGVVGRVTRMVKHRRYGPSGTKTPQRRTTGPLSTIQVKEQAVLTPKRPRKIKG
jgi:hypothetical protein